MMNKVLPYVLLALASLPLALSPRLRMPGPSHEALGRIGGLAVVDLVGVVVVSWAFGLNVFVVLAVGVVVHAALGIDTPLAKFLSIADHHGHQETASEWHQGAASEWHQGTVVFME